MMVQFYSLSEIFLLIPIRVSLKWSLKVLMAKSEGVGARAPPYEDLNKAGGSVRKHTLFSVYSRGLNVS